MNKILKKEYDLRINDFDKFDHIKPSAVLDLFQDVAGRHAKELGVGFESMRSRSYFWVLVKTRFQIVSQPQPNQKVVVKTWPLEPSRLMYRREYMVESENGDKLIEGSSEWVVMHSEKRRLVSVPDLYSFEDGFCTEMNFGAKLEKVENFEAENPPYTIVPGFSDLDTNDHVNNIKYADFVLDAVNPEEAFETEVFQIDYRKEVFSGSKLNIYYKKA